MTRPLQTRLEELEDAVEADSRVIALTATLTLDRTIHADKTLLLAEPGGDAALTVTLPPAIGSGEVYDFIVTVVNTSGYVIKVADATDTIDGTVVTNSTGDTPDLAQPWIAGASDDTITLNGTTTGGVGIGDRIQLQDVALNQWVILTGRTTSSGTEATPFSATVS